MLASTPGSGLARQLRARVTQAQGHTRIHVFERGGKLAKPGGNSLVCDCSTWLLLLLLLLCARARTAMKHENRASGPPALSFADHAWVCAIDGQRLQTVVQFNCLLACLLVCLFVCLFVAR